jgi:glycosyltransferase involved in cell wall biosynthesis
MNSSKGQAYISVIVPAYNEEKNIEKILLNIKKLSQYKLQILVAVDSKTTDNTAKIAKQNKAEVLLTKKTLGKGDVIRQAISQIKGDYAIQIDADSQFLPSDIPKLIKPLEEGYDVTLGTRYQKGAHVQKGSVSPIKRFGSFFLSAATSVGCGVRITDVMAGFKAFKTPVLKKIKPKDPYFGYEAELVIKAAKRKYKILNVPISYKKRIIGQSTVNSLKHGFEVLQTIVSTTKNG